MAAPKMVPRIMGNLHVQGFWVGVKRSLVGHAETFDQAGLALQQVLCMLRKVVVCPPDAARLLEHMRGHSS